MLNHKFILILIFLFIPLASAVEPLFCDYYCGSYGPYTLTCMGTDEDACIVNNECASVGPGSYCPPLMCRYYSLCGGWWDNKYSYGNLGLSCGNECYCDGQYNDCCNNVPFNNTQETCCNYDSSLLCDISPDIGCCNTPSGECYDKLTEKCIWNNNEGRNYVVPIKCGDGTTDFGEECDDHNNYNCDGCSADCKDEFCGDGKICTNHGEQCDDGDGISGDGCSSSCLIEYCGDGIAQQALGEECDKGTENGVPCSGCTSDCQKEMYEFTVETDIQPKPAEKKFQQNGNLSYEDVFDETYKCLVTIDETSDCEFTYTANFHLIYIIVQNNTQFSFDYTKECNNGCEQQFLHTQEYLYPKGILKCQVEVTQTGTNEKKSSITQLEFPNFDIFEENFEICNVLFAQKFFLPFIRGKAMMFALWPRIDSDLITHTENNVEFKLLLKDSAGNAVITPITKDKKVLQSLASETEITHMMRYILFDELFTPDDEYFYINYTIDPNHMFKLDFSTGKSREYKFRTETNSKKIEIVPVFINNPGLINYPSFRKLYEQQFIEQVNFFIKTSPLLPKNVKIAPALKFHEEYSTWPKWPPLLKDWGYSYPLNELNKMALEREKELQDTKVIYVGIVPEDFIGEKIGGTTLPYSYKNALLINADMLQEKPILAHELGHLYGLYLDEEQYDIIPLFGSLAQDGFCLDQDTAKQCNKHGERITYGNRAYYDIMGSGDMTWSTTEYFNRFREYYTK